MIPRQEQKPSCSYEIIDFSSNHPLMYDISNDDDDDDVGNKKKRLRLGIMRASRGGAQSTNARSQPTFLPIFLSNSHKKPLIPNFDFVGNSQNSASTQPSKNVVSEYSHSTYQFKNSAINSSMNVNPFFENCDQINSIELRILNDFFLSCDQTHSNQTVNVNNFFRQCDEMMRSSSERRIPQNETVSSINPNFYDFGDIKKDAGTFSWAFHNAHTHLERQRFKEEAEKERYQLMVKADYRMIPVIYEHEQSITEELQFFQKQCLLHPPSIAYKADDRDLRDFIWEKEELHTFAFGYQQPHESKYATLMGRQLEAERKANIRNAINDDPFNKNASQMNQYSNYLKQKDFFPLNSSDVQKVINDYKNLQAEYSSNSSIITFREEYLFSENSRLSTTFGSNFYLHNLSDAVMKDFIQNNQISINDSKISLNGSNLVNDSKIGKTLGISNNSTISLHPDFVEHGDIKANAGPCAFAYGISNPMEVRKFKEEADIEREERKQKALYRMHQKPPPISYETKMDELYETYQKQCQKPEHKAFKAKPKEILNDTQQTTKKISKSFYEQNHDDPLMIQTLRKQRRELAEKNSTISLRHFKRCLEETYRKGNLSTSLYDETESLMVHIRRQQRKALNHSTISYNESRFCLWNLNSSQALKNATSDNSTLFSKNLYRDLKTKMANDSTISLNPNILYPDPIEREELPAWAFGISSLRDLRGFFEERQKKCVVDISTPEENVNYELDFERLSKILQIVERCDDEMFQSETTNEGIMKSSGCYPFSSDTNELPSLYDSELKFIKEQLKKLKIKEHEENMYQLALKLEEDARVKDEIETEEREESFNNLMNDYENDWQEKNFEIQNGRDMDIAEIQERFFGGDDQNELHEEKCEIKMAIKANVEQLPTEEKCERIDSLFAQGLAIDNLEFDKMEAKKKAKMEAKEKKILEKESSKQKAKIEKEERKREEIAKKEAMKKAKLEKDAAIQRENAKREAEKKKAKEEKKTNKFNFNPLNLFSKKQTEVNINEIEYGIPPQSCADLIGGGKGKKSQDTLAKERRAKGIIKRRSQALSIGTDNNDSTMSTDNETEENSSSAPLKRTNNNQTNEVATKRTKVASENAKVDSISLEVPDAHGNVERSASMNSFQLESNNNTQFDNGEGDVLHHVFIEPPNFNGVTLPLEVYRQLRSDEYLGGDHILNCLSSMAACGSGRKYKKIGVLDPFYLIDPHPIIDENVLRIKNYLKVYNENPDLVLCPINHANFHWTILIADVKKRKAYYYDTLGDGYYRANFTATERQKCEKILNDLSSANIIPNNIQLVKAPTTSYDRQLDGINCGLHDILIPESYILNGESRRLPALDTIVERNRINYVLERLARLNGSGCILRINIPEWPWRTFEDLINPSVPTNQRLNANISNDKSDRLTQIEIDDCEVRDQIGYDNDEEDEEKANYEGLFFNSVRMLSEEPKKFNDVQVTNFLCSMAGHASKIVFSNITVLDPLFISSYKMGKPLKIKDCLRVFPTMPDLILCPIPLQDNNWTILIINCNLETALFFDPLPLGAKLGVVFGEEELDICTMIMNELKSAKIINDNINCERAPYDSFNYQELQGDSAFNIMLIAEHVSFFGESMFFEKDKLNIKRENARFRVLLAGLYLLNLERQDNEHINIPNWLPTCFEYIEDQAYDVFPDEPRDLLEDNDLIQQKNVAPPSTQRITQLRRSQRVLPRTAKTKQLYDDKRTKQINSLRQQGKPVALNSSKINPERHYLGPMNIPCRYKCGAMLFKGETSNACCSYGTVPIPNVPQMPPIWEAIAAHPDFWKLSTQFNSLMAMISTSANVKRHADTFKVEGELKHTAGDLNPNLGANPMFVQNYTIDSNQACENRISDLTHKLHFKAEDAVKHKELIGLLEAMLRECHPLAKILANTKDILAEVERKAALENKVLRKFYLVWESGSEKNTNPGCFTLPTVGGQVFTLYHAEEDSERPKGIWFGISKDGSNDIRHIPHYNSYADAAAYPLIFIYGQEGWRPGMKKLKPAVKNSFTNKKNPLIVASSAPQHIQTQSTVNAPISAFTQAAAPLNILSDDNYDILNEKGLCSDSDEDFDECEDDLPKTTSKKRENISLKQHYSSLPFDRNEKQLKEFNPMNGLRELTQKFYIGAWLNVQRQRLDWIEKLQAAEDRQKRYDQCNRLREALQAKINRDEALRGKELGKIILLNKDFRGSRRYMEEQFKDNIAIANRYGFPTLFPTFTGNPNWPEITENLRPGETWIQRPDLTVRVFKLKAKEFLKDVIERNIFGKVLAYSVSLEIQKRGMPHLHLLLTMEEGYKYNDPTELDDLITAQLPVMPDENDTSYDAEYQLRYHDSVLKFMMHDPRKCKGICGPGKKEGICSKDFPKNFSDETVIRTDGFAALKRPADRREIDTFPSGKRRNIPMTNQHVVAHNRYLILKYNCHINLEHCGGLKCVKYLYKYIYKGNDQAFVSVREIKNSPDTSNKVDYNEITQYRKMQLMSATEAILGLIGMFRCKKSHSVEVLDVHLESEHNVVFDPNDDEETLNKLTENDGVEEEDKAVSKLTAFFKLVNDECEAFIVNPFIFDDDDKPRSMDLYYHQIPEYYRWDKKNKEWIRRKNEVKVVGRLRCIYPSEVEKYCLRELLRCVKGPSNYGILKWYKKVQYKTFHEAAVARGLYVDDKMCYSTMEEIISSYMPRDCRTVFALLLIYNQPKDPAALWNDHWKSLIDHNPDIPEEIRIRKALAHIASILFHHQKTLKDFNLPDVSEDDLIDSINNVFPTEDNDGEADYKQLNDEQRAFVDKVIESIKNKKDLRRLRLFFLQGSGGTGKTFVYNTLIRMLRARGLKVIAVASTGIAATLLDGGTTAHSAFHIPLDIHQEPNIPKNSPLARLIREADVIIWDEAPMQHKSVLKHVAGLIKNLVGLDEHHSKFGNKTVILGGDFKQLLPVMRNESARASFEASLLCSPLFRDNFKIHTLKTNVRAADDPNYAAWINDVGNGRNQSTTFGINKVQLPDDIVFYHPQPVIDFVYPPEFFEWDTKSQKYLDYVSEAVLMAPLNQTVKDLNEMIISKLKGDHKDYVANNIMTSTLYPDDEILRENFTSEELANFEHSSIPSNTIRLKVGTVVMLTRNILIPLGLCNGTRMVVEKMYDHHIACRILTGRSKGLIYPIVAVLNNFSDQSDDSLPDFTRMQLPIRPAFAITINKGQGQTLRKVGIILYTDSFSHGQFYVAVSRVRERKDIRIFVRQQNTGFAANGQKIPHAQNIVFKEVLTAIKQQDDDQQKDMNAQQVKASQQQIFNDVIDVIDQINDNMYSPLSTPSASQFRIDVNSALPMYDVTHLTQTFQYPSSVINNVSSSQISQPQYRSANDCLKLKNVFNDCFLISAVNAIDLMKELKDSFHNVPENDAASHHELMKVLSGEVPDVQALRNSYPNYRYNPNTNDQHDGFEMFSTLIQSLHELSRSLFEFPIYTYHVCECGRVPQQPTMGSMLELNVVNSLTKQVTSTFDGMLENFVGPNVITSFMCTKQHEIVSNDVYSFTRSQTYLNVGINNVDATGQPRFIASNSLHINGHEIGGAKWKLIGAIQHIARNHHYVTWRRNEDNKWIVIDDSNSSIVCNRLLDDLAKYRCLIFQRIFNHEQLNSPQQLNIANNDADAQLISEQIKAYFKVQDDANEICDDYDDDVQEEVKEQDEDEEDDEKLFKLDD